MVALVLAAFVLGAALAAGLGLVCAHSGTDFCPARTPHLFPHVRTAYSLIHSPPPPIHPVRPKTRNFFLGSGPQG